MAHGFPVDGAPMARMLAIKLKKVTGNRSKIVVPKLTAHLTAEKSSRQVTAAILPSIGDEADEDSFGAQMPGRTDTMNSLPC